jgi:hypothetical protein
VSTERTLYRGGLGLANRVPPELIPFDPETGVAGLQVADNMLIGEAGQLYGRQGSRQVFSTEACHSPFPVPGGMLFVREKESGPVITLAKHDASGLLTLKELAPGEGEGEVKSGGNWLSWFELDGEYWWSTECGRGAVSGDFLLPRWPDSEEPMKGRNEFKYGKVPFGRHIEQLGPFTLSAIGRDVLWSEPGLPDLRREVENISPAEGPVLLLASVQDGVFVSDNKQVWFFQGREPRKWTVRRVLDYPAIEYCKIHGLVSASAMGFEAGGLGVVFMTVRGPVFGFSDGTIANLTDKQFAMPDCVFTRGSMMMVNQSQLIISVE